MRKIFKRLHKWLAIPVGFIISITCLSGAILVFQDEILEVYYPDHYFVKDVKENRIPLDQLIPMVNSQLTDNSIADVKVSSDPKRTYIVTLSEGTRVSAFVDPYTAKITGQYEPRESFFWTVMSIHRWLMDGSRTWGKYTVGIATLLFAFILISGFILWVPRSKKKLKNYFTIKTTAGRKRLFYDLHNVLGFYAGLILLVCALTGLMWSFEWYRNGVFKIFGAEAPTQRAHGRNNANEKKEKKEINTLYWQDVLNTIQTSNPDYEYIRIQDGSATVHLASSFRSRANDKYDFDKKTGQISKITLYEQQAKTSQIWGFVYSLHVGNYWGIYSKILTFIAALIGASLPITGYYLFFVKRNKKKQRKAQIES